VYFKMLEVYEVECLNPPKQPEIPEPEAKWAPSAWEEALKFLITHN
jgi:hypothetical protein